jgi:hypothetical protein
MTAPRLTPDLADLLLAVARHPRCSLAAYAQTGDKLVEPSWVARRFDKLFAAGYIDAARNPAITQAGRDALAALSR